VTTPVGHVCQALPLNVFQKAIDGGIVNKGLINIIEVCEEFPVSDDDGVVQHSDLLLLRKGHGGGFRF